jgi:transitional endoplasmic reticulum ATPase
MQDYERWMIRRYLANALKASQFGRMPDADGDIVAWLNKHGRSLGVPRLSYRRSTRNRILDLEAPQTGLSWKAWRAEVIAIADTPAPEPSALQRRLDWLADACSLSAAQRTTLGLIARYTYVPTVSALVASISDRSAFEFSIPDVSYLSIFLETRRERLELSAPGRLAQFGLIDVSDELRLSDIARHTLSLRRLGTRKPNVLLFGNSASALLSWEEFAHLGELRDIAARIVGSAGRSRRVPQNNVDVLLYGPSGSGKTEFAKTLGAHLGFSVRFSNGSAKDSGEAGRRERIAALMIANAACREALRTILVVDDANELFAGTDEADALARQGDSYFLDRLAAGSSAPTIWITNAIERLGPEFVRRMSLVIRFSTPNVAVRKTVVRRIAKRANFRLAEDSVLALSQSRAHPALIENALRSTAVFGGSPANAIKILDSNLQALGIRKPPAASAPLSFDPTLSAADVDLARLADQVVRSPSHALSFCLSGPPGTGKSAYARYLAERLNMEVLEKRYSNLTSMWLGESEKAIAAAFEEAADSHAFLIFDEADSLLRDRRAANHSWEITQVNEMLTWMERHPYPIACTTNALDLIDTAAARRFLFKVTFLPMTLQQIAVTYRRLFADEAPRSILMLEMLTPGDFAVVARKAEALDEHDRAQIDAWIEAEVRAKPHHSRRIGF